MTVRVCDRIRAVLSEYESLLPGGQLVDLVQVAYSVLSRWNDAEGAAELSKAISVCRR